MSPIVVKKSQGILRIPLKIQKNYSESQNTVNELEIVMCLMQKEGKKSLSFGHCFG